MNTLEKQIQQIDTATEGLIYITILIAVVLTILSIKYFKTKIKYI
jgi:hypothetical protein